MALAGSSRAPLPVVAVTGLNGSGGITLTEVKVGDLVLGVQNIATLATESGSFETTISVAGQLKQTSSSNLSANQYFVYVAAQS